MTAPAIHDVSGYDVSTTTIAIIAAFTRCAAALVRPNRSSGNTGSTPNGRRSSTVKPSATPRMRNASPTQGLPAQTSRQQGIFESLAASLRIAPTEIAEVYARGLRECGRVFVQGDEVARAALLKTLAKLNAGFMDVLATIVREHGASEEVHRKKVHKTQAKKAGETSKTTVAYDIDVVSSTLSEADASALTLLSSTSRVEVVDALSSLRSRLAAKLAPILLPFTPPVRCTLCGVTGHDETVCARLNAESKACRSQEMKLRAGRIKASSHQKGTGMTLALVSSDSGGEEKQWAIVRTKPNNATKRRPHPSTAHSASLSKAKGAKSPMAINVATPEVTAATLSSASRHAIHARAEDAPKAAKTGESKTRASLNASKMHSRLSQPFSQPYVHGHAERFPVQTDTPRAKPASDPPPLPSSPRGGDARSAQQPQARPHPVPSMRTQSKVQRRQTVASIYSFQSASTKLGEIPMDKWPQNWWSWDEAEQLNAKQAAWTGGPREASSATKQTESSRDGSGLLRRIFRKGRGRT